MSTLKMLIMNFIPAFFHTMTDKQIVECLSTVISVIFMIFERCKNFKAKRADSRSIDENKTCCAQIISHR